MSRDSRPGHTEPSLVHAEPLAPRPTLNLAASTPSSDTSMFQPEDPFAYPQLDEIGGTEREDADKDQDATQLRLFPEVCGVTEAQLLNPLDLANRE